MTVRLQIVYGGLSSGSVQSDVEKSVGSRFQRFGGLDTKELLQSFVSLFKDECKLPNGSVIELSRKSNHVLKISTIVADQAIHVKRGRMLEKVGTFFKDLIPDSYVVELNACVRTIYVNQHEVSNRKDVCLKRCRSTTLCPRLWDSADHAGCIRSRGDQLECCPEGPWPCSHDCSNIFQRLQGLVGKSIPTSEEGLTFTVLRSSKLPEEEAMAAEEHGKLCAAFDVLHECFVTLIEPLTQSDLSHDIVFNRESELRRLNFRGFYVVGLEKGGELITVGTLRVYGKKVAELPLVGTRFAHRRQGMCHLLMNQLEKLLGELGVERLVLPVVPELLQTWTGSFGFHATSHSDKMEIAEHTIMCFQGTTMCHKFITKATAP